MIKQSKQVLCILDDPPQCVQHTNYPKPQYMSKIVNKLNPPSSVLTLGEDQNKERKGTFKKI